MVPIHDSDIAEERWSKAEWDHYELWEKIEVRLRRKKWLWITATLIVFLALSSIPIVVDRAPKWQTLNLGRRLAQELNTMKKEASLEHAAFRIYFTGTHYHIEKVPNCSAPLSSGTSVHEGDLGDEKESAAVVLLQPSEGMTLGIPGLLNETCYDSYSGSDVVSHPGQLAGFGILPIQDGESVKKMPNSTDFRLDRLTVVFLKGNSAEISIE